MKTTLSAGTQVVSRSKIITFGSIVVALAIAATAIGLILTGSGYEVAPQGITDTGPLIGGGVVFR